MWIVRKRVFLNTLIVLPPFQFPKLACKIRAFRQRHRSYANGKSVQDGAPKVAFSCLINDFTDITWYNYSYWESKWFINQLIFGGGHPVPVAEKSVNTLSVYPRYAQVLPYTLDLAAPLELSTTVYQSRILQKKMKASCTPTTDIHRLIYIYIHTYR